MGKSYASHEMLHTKLPAGKWFINVAPLGEKPRWSIEDGPTRPAGILKKGARNGQI